jgi:hypothetical protein
MDDWNDLNAAANADVIEQRHLKRFDCPGLLWVLNPVCVQVEFNHWVAVGLKQYLGMLAHH